jgi:hypothetical protein
MGRIQFEKFVTRRGFGHNGLEMTAIISIYTPNGFVIGADGRRVGRNSETVITESAQKLLYFQSENTRLIYAWRGSTHFLDDQGQAMFDFLAVSEPILRISSYLERNDFGAFVAVFQRMLYAALLQSVSVVGMDFFKGCDDKEVAKMLLSGYFDGNPCEAEISVRHHYSGFSEPVVTAISVPPPMGCNIFSAPQSVIDTFSKRAPESNDEAITYAREYIKAGVDSSNSDCEGVGGHIHVAKLTREEFSWVDPPVSA